MKQYNSYILICISFFLFSCNSSKLTTKAPQFQNNAQKLVYDMIQKVGDYTTLAAKKDVIYTYTYQTPDGKKDVSTEKYIFDGELSYGKYDTHQRTFADLKGSIEQGFNGSNYWLKHNGTVLNDADRLKRVAFNRPTNFYWFAMWQKLMDPGLTYEYIDETTIGSNQYDIVKVSFKSMDGKPKDIYQLYINKTTSLVDQFLFTVADFGVIDTPYLMKVTHENVDGILIPAKRKYKKSTWDGHVSDDPWINVSWTNIRFNNNLSPSDFSI
jgi:hypothetical protein